MNRQEELDHLKKELELLQGQLHAQQEQLDLLKRKIAQLSGNASPVTPLITAKRQASFSIENFIGLRLIHLIGIVVLVIGLSIGVKYAIDRDLVSEGMRILLAYVAGLVLYFFSLRLRKNYTGFSAILFSGAMASLYFTTYAAYVYYGMFPFAVAFILMILLTVYTVLEAIRYNRQEIAMLGLTGAYAIPFLISKNADRADLFFLYIAVINIGVVFLSVKKLWKNVGITAQSITWLLFIGWAAVRFTEKMQATGLWFMLFFFLLFLFNVLAFKILHKKHLGVNDTYQLVLNNFALYIGALFVLGLALDADADLSLITFITAAVVALQALLMQAFWREESFTVRILSLSALGLFVLFIAFKWDGFTVTLLWLLVAVIIFSWGVVIRSVAARMTAILLIGLTLGKLLAFDSLSFTTVQKVIAYLVLGVLLLVVSFFYQKFKQKLFGDNH